MIDITRPPSTRIFGIVARKAPRVLILRRGPSKQLLAIMWHTDSDEFHAGQWFKGRIHEHRCDLSPSGSKFILLGRAGRLWRVPMSRKSGPAAPRELIDLRSQRFVAAAPPEEAISWTGENPVGRRIR